MAYVKKDWQDLPSQTTPVTADDLDRIENGIENNDKRLNGTAVAGEMVVDSIRSKNMFDGILEQGAYGFGDGANISTTNYCRSVHKIPIIEGKTYTLSFVSSVPITLNDCGFVFFNNDTYVSGQSNTLTVTVPNGANYMVFNISAYPNTITPSDISNVQLEEGSTATTFYPYQDLDGMEIYSNGETLIGTFLGKPLYRKVVDIGNVTAGVQKTGVTGATNVDRIVNQKAVAYIGNNCFHSQDMFTYNNGLYYSAYNANENMTNCILIIEYTKTTD